MVVLLPVGLSPGVEDNWKKDEEDDQETPHQDDKPNFLQNLGSSATIFRRHSVVLPTTLQQDGVHCDLDGGRKRTQAHRGESGHANEVGSSEKSLSHNLHCSESTLMVLPFNFFHLPEGQVI